VVSSSVAVVTAVLQQASVAAAVKMRSAAVIGVVCAALRVNNTMYRIHCYSRR
jgi:hypothetical protein